MIPAAFDYHAPETLEEALALLRQHPDDAKVLSGGQSLLPLLKLRLGMAGHLVDINRVPGLEYIREEGGGCASAAGPGRATWSARRWSVAATRCWRTPPT
jgi:carbon-monoxide dehydrogenase medium subunit